jgi:hypothetical protein
VTVICDKSLKYYIYLTAPLKVTLPSFTIIVLLEKDPLSKIHIRT